MARRTQSPAPYSAPYLFVPVLALGVHAAEKSQHKSGRVSRLTCPQGTDTGRCRRFVREMPVSRWWKVCHYPMCVSVTVGPAATVKRRLLPFGSIRTVNPLPSGIPSPEFGAGPIDPDSDHLLPLGRWEHPSRCRQKCHHQRQGSVP